MARQTLVQPKPQKSAKRLWWEHKIRRPIVKASRRAAFAWRKGRSTVLVVGGFSAIDVGAFHLNTVVGWLTLGLSLLVMDFQNKGTR